MLSGNLVCSLTPVCAHISLMMLLGDLNLIGWNISNTMSWVGFRRHTFTLNTSVMSQATDQNSAGTVGWWIDQPIDRNIFCNCFYHLNHSLSKTCWTFSGLIYCLSLLHIIVTWISVGHNKEFEDVSLETVMDIFREQTVKGIISKTNEQVLIVSCYPRSEPISRILSYSQSRGGSCGWRLQYINKYWGQGQEKEI